MATRKRPIIIFTALALLVIALGVTSVFFYRRYHRLSLDSTAVTAAETKALVEEVGKLIVLPTDETPTVATVSDPDKLKDQAFFSNAKKGDKVLIYTNAKEAILYDPSIKKIVTVAPINIGAGTPGNVPQAGTQAGSGTSTTP